MSRGACRRIAGGFRERQVPARHLSPVPASGMADDAQDGGVADREVREDPRGRVRGSVVHDDDLQVRIAGREDRLERLADVPLAVVNGHEDADPRGGAPAHPRSPVCTQSDGSR